MFFSHFGSVKTRYKAPTSPLSSWCYWLAMVIQCHGCEANHSSLSSDKVKNVQSSMSAEHNALTLASFWCMPVSVQNKICHLEKHCGMKMGWRMFIWNPLYRCVMRSFNSEMCHPRCVYEWIIGIWVQSITQQVYLTRFIEDENITTCFGLIRPSSDYIQRVSEVCNNYAVI